MAPPLHPFPVGELEQRIQTHTVNYKEKSRKLPKDFRLKDCELFELVQYSCTTSQQQMEEALKNPTGNASIQCHPFVRLLRRCQHRDQVFHVETTAWEGQHAWEPKEEVADESLKDSKANTFAQYGSFFWTKT